MMLLRHMVILCKLVQPSKPFSYPLNPCLQRHMRTCGMHSLVQSADHPSELCIGTFIPFFGCGFGYKAILTVGASI